MKRIAVIYASEGTGHRAAAEALREWFMSQDAEREVFCADVLEYLPTLPRRLLSGGYVFMARHAQWAWNLFYKSSDKASFTARVFDKIHNQLCGIYLPRLEADLDEFKPDAVFFTHYFGAAPFARRSAGHFPTFCVDTDFLTHRFQRNAAFTAAFAASDEAVLQRTEEGIVNVFCAGIPVSRKFSEAITKSEAREKLGFDENAATILLSGGGIGAGSLEKALESLAAKREWQTAAICGNNKRLYSRLSAKHTNDRNVRVEGFVTNIELYYAAADILIMKPGGLSLSEALCAGVPLILFDPVPGQEELNLQYAVEKGAAIHLQASGRTAGVVKSILRDQTRLESMREAALALARPAAAAEILEIADRICGKYK